MNEKDIKHIVTAFRKKFKWEAIDYDKIESIISPTDCKVIAVLDGFRTMIEAVPIYILCPYISYSLLYHAE